MKLLNLFNNNKNKFMYDLAAEMDKLEDDLINAGVKEDHSKTGLGELIVLAKPVIVIASNLFFLPRNARNILKALLKGIAAYEKGKAEIN